jgi:hypothetical protein
MTSEPTRLVGDVGGTHPRWRRTLPAVATLLGLVVALSVFSKLTGDPGASGLTMIVRLRGDELELWTHTCVQPGWSVLVAASSDGAYFDQQIVGPVALSDGSVDVPPITLSSVEPTQLVAVMVSGPGYFEQASGTLSELRSRGITNQPKVHDQRFDDVSTQQCKVA